MLDEIVERAPFKINRMEWVKKALEHASHHRGQCAVYLRLNNITPPQYKLPSIWRFDGCQKQYPILSNNLFNLKCNQIEPARTNSSTSI